MEYKNIKENINCYLELYSKEIHNLMEESTYLYEKINSKPNSYWEFNKQEYKNILEQIKDIETSGEALLTCKNDCIADL